MSSGTLRHDTMNTVCPCDDRIADERVLGLQVEDVVLVDARRHHHQRPLINLLGRRRILDHWISSFSIDDRARRDRDDCVRPRTPISSVIEMRPFSRSAFKCSSPRNRLSPLVSAASLMTSGLVGGKFAGAAASINCRVKKRSLFFVLRIELRRFDHFGQPARIDQVGLFQIIEEGQSLPFGRAETAVAFFRRDHRCGAWTAIRCARRDSSTAACAAGNNVAAFAEHRRVVAAISCGECSHHFRTVSAWLRGQRAGITCSANLRLAVRPSNNACGEGGGDGPDWNRLVS